MVAHQTGDGSYQIQLIVSLPHSIYHYVPLLDFIVREELLPTVDAIDGRFRQRITSEPTIMNDFRYHIYKINYLPPVMIAVSVGIFFLII